MFPVNNPTPPPPSPQKTLTTKCQQKLLIILHVKIIQNFVHLKSKNCPKLRKMELNANMGA